MSRSAARLAGRLDGLLGEVHGAVDVRERAQLLAPARGRQHDVREPRGLRQEHVLDDDHQVVPLEDSPHARELGQRDRRVRRGDPEQLDRALLGVAPDLHRVRRRRPVRDQHLVDVPELGELADVLLVLPVAQTREVAVGARLAGVLGRRLAVHLVDARTRAPDHAAQQMQVVDLARGRRRLIRLIEALQHRREQPLGRAHELGGFADLAAPGCRRSRPRAPACRPATTRSQPSKPIVCAST